MRVITSKVNGLDIQFIISSDRDIVDAVRLGCGDDLSELVERKIKTAGTEGAYAHEAVNTDLASYESQLDSNNSCFYDVLDIADELLEMTNGRINKAKLIDKLDEIKSIINCQV